MKTVSKYDIVKSKKGKGGKMKKEERKILEVKRALELVKSRNFKELEKEFEPETECEKCYFCMKPNDLIKGKVPRVCLIGPRTLGENVRGCYGGWRKR